MTWNRIVIGRTRSAVLQERAGKVMVAPDGAFIRKKELKMRLVQKLAVGGIGLVGAGIGSLGLGVAYAQTPASSSTASTVVAHQGSQVAPDRAKVVTAKESDAPGGPQDLGGANVQSGAQGGLNTGGPDSGANR